MKITFAITATLGGDELFSIIKEYIESKTDYHLANIRWNVADGKPTCSLIFCEEKVDLEKVKV